MVHHDSPMCFWMIYHDLPMCCLVNQQNMINHLFGWIIMIYRYFCGIYHDFLGVSWFIFIYHDFWGTMIYKSVMMYHDLSQFGGCLDIYSHHWLITLIGRRTRWARCRSVLGDARRNRYVFEASFSRRLNIILRRKYYGWLVVWNIFLFSH